MQQLFDYIDSIPEEYKFFYLLGWEVFIIVMIVTYGFFIWLAVHYIREWFRNYKPKGDRGKHSRKNRTP